MKLTLPHGSACYSSDLPVCPIDSNVGNPPGLTCFTINSACVKPCTLKPRQLTVLAAAFSLQAVTQVTRGTEHRSPYSDPQKKKIQITDFVQHALRRSENKVKICNNLEYTQSIHPILTPSLPNPVHSNNANVKN